MNKKALNPVLASIILIAVTVAVSIAVAAWMGALTYIDLREVLVEVEDISITFGDSEIKAFIRENNITVFQSPKKLFVIFVEGDYYSTELQEGKELVPTLLVYSQEFLMRLEIDNVEYLLTDFAPFKYPKSMMPNTNYNLETYHYWYYADLPNVGKVAIVYQTQVTAFYGVEND